MTNKRESPADIILEMFTARLDHRRVNKLSHSYTLLALLLFFTGLAVWLVIPGGHIVMAGAVLGLCAGMVSWLLPAASTRGEREAVMRADIEWENEKAAIVEKIKRENEDA